MKDIKFRQRTNDMVFEDINTSKPYPFAIIDENESYVYGAIIVPFSYDNNRMYKEGIIANIPYTPVEKPLRVCVKKEVGDSLWVDIVNPANNTIWFDVTRPNKAVNICEYIMINPKFKYLLMFSNRGYCNIYSSVFTDAVVSNALKQNKDMLVQCVPSSNYRYPASGVGIVKYLHSNIAHTDLASRIISEFADDGMNVTRATYNEETNELYIETT